MMPAAALAVGATVWLAAGELNGVTTVPQGDRMRSPVAPRSADVSSDGRFIAFESWSRLVPADTDNDLDIYVLERSTGNVTLESVPDNGATEYSTPRINGDGRFVVFERRSYVDDNRRFVDIVVRDRQAGTVRVVTEALRTQSIDAWSRSPAISDDGRVIAFSSAGALLTSQPDANGLLEDIYVVQLASGELRRASVTSDGLQLPRGTSILPALSRDGRWLVFASTAPLDAAPGSARRQETAPVRQIFLRDLTLGTTTRVSRPVRGDLPDGDSSLPAISGDASHIVYVSSAGNLLARATKGSHVFHYDRAENATTLVSRGTNGDAANGNSTNPTISDDGRFVAFQSDASNLVCAPRRCPPHLQDINLIWDVFIYDRTRQITARVSDDELGGWMEPSSAPSIDATGRVLAFSSRHPIDTSDTDGDFDLFIRDWIPSADLTQKQPQFAAPH